MEVGRKYINQFARSPLCSKGRLKGVRVIVILFIFISLVIDLAKHFGGGVAVARDFTSFVMLLYFIVMLGISYSFTTSTHEISKRDLMFSHIASAFFAISLTSALFDTVIFWALLYPHYHPKITFYIINSYVLNLVIIIAETFWSLMIVPASRFIYAIIGSGVYIGVYFLWDYLDKGHVINLHVLPDIGIPKYAMIVVTVVVLYNASFWVMYGVAALRTYIYNYGFSKEEKYHILDSQTF